MEITRQNFAEQFDNIAKDIKLSSFIGFDAEFTALPSEQFKYRLFDTNKKRYDRIKAENSQIIMIQVGLSMFQYNRHDESYVATTYTFHLCPQTFGEIDQTFIFQASTLNFHCTHNFDFNKFIYNGIPYLSKTDEARVRKMLEGKVLFDYLTGALGIDDKKLLQHHCSQVCKWVDYSDVDTMYIDLADPVLRYILHNEIRLRYSNVLTTNSLGNSNKILLYRNKNVEGANSVSMTTLEENLVDQLLGFSRIVSLISKSQKPLIGHNMFMDIILLHIQFIGQLPKKYTSFKKNINEMFPIIFDTKFISHEMWMKLSYNEVWKTNGLQDLYEFFLENKCNKLQKGVNTVRLSIPFRANQSYHEAGLDSYCSAYCFLRLAHWAASEYCGSYIPLVPAQLLAALDPMVNKVNVIRGAVTHMNLVGEDESTGRPRWLHVKTLSERVIDADQLVAVLESGGYNVDVQVYGRRTALIAATTQHMMKKILSQFRDSRDYKISPYSVYRHSPASRIAIWGGVLLAGSLIFYLIPNKLM